MNDHLHRWILFRKRSDDPRQEIGRDCREHAEFDFAAQLSLQILNLTASLVHFTNNSFRPVPKVDSSVVRLVPLREAKATISDVALFGRVVAAAFGQRRKTMRNALSTICDEAGLERAGIDPGVRGETLSVAEFVRLANDLAGRAA